MYFFLDAVQNVRFLAQTQNRMRELERGMCTKLQSKMVESFASGEDAQEV